MTGSIRRRGKRSWAVILSLGKDPAGRYRQKWHTVRGTRKDAERELTRLLYELDAGTYVEPSRTTVSDYLTRWLQDVAKHQVSAKTFERYDEIVRCHLSPALGSVMLSKLQPLQIQAYYSQALKSGRRQGAGGLAPLTVRHHHRVLRQALQQAVRWQLLSRNPAAFAEPPRVQQSELHVLDESQTAKLLAASRGTAIFVPIVLAVTTGLRRGEILALRWTDVDLEGGTLAVQRSLEQTRTGLSFKAPKTAKSRRVIALPPLTVEVVRRHRVEQARIRLMVGPAYADHGLVCPRIQDGEPLAPRSLTHAFMTLMRRLPELPRVRFHDLRHTHASHLLRQNIHPKVVSERLGHASIGITLDVYSHVLPGMQEEAARRIEVVLRAAIEADQPG